MVPAWLELLFACPACADSVVSAPAAYVCRRCDRSFPLRYGIPDFRLEPDPYISVADEIKKIEGFWTPERSFDEMVRAYYVLTPESPPELHSRYVAAMAASRLRGEGLLRKLDQRFPAAGHTDLVDLGCGTAGLSIAAARSYQRVVGVDVALRWLVMGRRRLEEEKVDVPLVCANAESLPFRSDAFGAVAADAVLEHVRRPARMRDEVLRVLRPGGAFFFTTNNRFSILPEPHVRIWGFGFLPRRWMEPLAWRVRRTPYKTRLLSRRALKELFRQSGNVLLPYFERGELGERNEPLRLAWERMSQSPVARLLLGAVVPQYFVVGEKSGRAIPRPSKRLHRTAGD